MPTLEYPKNPNTDTAFVVQDDGVTRNRALMTAPQDISTLELPNNPNSTKGYVTVNGKKQRVVLTAEIAGGGGGGSIDTTKVINKANSLPTADASTSGKVYMYSGETDGTYTHGYIYECVNTPTYSDTVTFDPATISGINVNANPNSLANLMAEWISGDITTVVSGTMTYDQAGDLWILVAYDNDGNTVGSFQLYQQDYQDAGFSFSGTPQDGDVVAFTCTITATYSYEWVRLDVQPTPTADEILPDQSGHANEFLMTDGATTTWKAVKPEDIGAVTQTTQQVTLIAADWQPGTPIMQGLSVPGVTPTNTVIVSPDPASATDYASAGVICVAQGTDYLEFNCTTQPANDLVVNILLLN